MPARKHSPLEAAFYRLWQFHCRKLPQPTPEYTFAPPRRWRFDFAWLDQKVAVELEGGQWTGGRHTTGKGLQGDCSKQNQATLMGWCILRYTTTDMQQRPVQVVEEVAALLKQRTQP